MTSFNLCRYETIIFDLDSTLTNTKRYPIKASEWLLKEYPSDASEYLEPYLESLLRLYYSGIASVVKGGPYRPPGEIVHSAMKQSFETIGLDVDLELINRALTYFKQLHLDLSEEMPGARKLLNWLRQRSLKMGVYTNSFEGHAKMILEKINLLSYFDVVADGSNTMAFKPMPAVFEYVLLQLEGKLDSTLYIGDEYYADIVGASSIGLDAVWINMRGRSLDQNLEKYGQSTAPILVIKAIEELNDYRC